MKTLVRSLPVQFLALLLLAFTGRTFAQSSFGEAEYDQFLDASESFSGDWGLTLVPDTSPEGAGDASQIELYGDWTFTTYEDVLGGFVDLGMDAAVINYTDDAAIDLPNQLIVLAADVKGIWRYIGDYAFLAGLRPGFYTDLEDLELESLAFPGYLTFIKTLSPGFSGILGVEVRPGWELPVMPRAGIKWELADDLSLELTVPESQLTWDVDDVWFSYVNVEWHNMSYSLADDDGLDRESITLDYTDASIGVGCRFPDGFQVVGEIGQRFDRSIEFEDDGPKGKDKLDVDDSVFLGISLRRPL